MPGPPCMRQASQIRSMRASDGPARPSPAVRPVPDSCSSSARRRHRGNVMELGKFAELPKPPYFAVIFTSHRKVNDEEGYDSASRYMIALAEQVPGFLGAEVTRNANGFGVTV